MITIKSYKLQKNISNDYTLLLYLKAGEEFSEELIRRDEIEDNNFYDYIKLFINDKFPNLKISAVKILIGTTLITSFTIAPVVAQSQTYNTYTNYSVKIGDTLWKIANQYGISVTTLKELNHLTSDTIYIGQILKIPQANQSITIYINGKLTEFNPKPVVTEGVTYVPIRQIGEAIGASVWYNSDSNTIGINYNGTSVAFIAGSTTARVNGEKVTTPASKIINNTTYVPLRFISQTLGLNVDWNDAKKTVYISEKETAYTVKAGDSLWLIATRYGTTATAIKQANNLTSDTIYVGQKLAIPAQANQEPADQNQVYTEPTVTYTTHTVVSGDNIWSLSIKYGVPMTELLAVNNLTMDSNLTIGQKLKVPVHHIPVKPVVSSKHGELLDWWTEAQYVFAINDVAKVTDFQTGKSFYVKRTIGANHADSEPLTAADAAIMKEIWGGEYSWTARAVIVEVDGRRIAASMSSMPHDIQYIYNNDFDGHFDIHFLNSTRHSDGQIDESHQTQIKIAAGTQ